MSSTHRLRFCVARAREGLDQGNAAGHNGGMSKIIIAIVVIVVVVLVVRWLLSRRRV
jgi:hypothetical protein